MVIKPNQRDLYRQKLAESLMSAQNSSNPYDVSGSLKQLAGALMGYGASRNMAERESQAQDVMSQALRAGNGWTDPDTGKKVVSGDQQAMINVLLGNPDTADLGQKLTLGKMDQDRENEQWQDRFRQQRGADLEKFGLQAQIDAERRSADRQFQAEQNALNRQNTLNAAQIRAQNVGQTGALESVLDPTGKPIYVPRNQAVGMTPASFANNETFKTAQQKQTDATQAMDILKEAAPLVNQATGSGLGDLYDKTAGFFGKSTGGADSAAKLKVLGGALVSKMPKMQGPQSDKDVLLYKEMAGRIGDPTVPADQKRAAMETINALQAKYAGIEAQPLNFDNTAQNGFVQPPSGFVVR